MCQHSPVFLQSSDITVKCSYTKVLALPCVIACVCHHICLCHYTPVSPQPCDTIALCHPYSASTQPVSWSSVIAVQCYLPCKCHQTKCTKVKTSVQVIKPQVLPQSCVVPKPRVEQVMCFFMSRTDLIHEALLNN